jgi:hypothetical protein
LEDIENIPKEFLIASDIAPYLKSDVATIIYCAKNTPELLGFPVIVTGKLVRIPKHAFVYFCRYGRPAIDYNLLAAAVTAIEQQKSNRED